MKKQYKILDKVNEPQDLKALSKEELAALPKDIRRFLVEHVAETGGHLASNLGVVELTCALHYCFDLPTDQIVWDVGHQSYVHKVLTGRKDRFETLRQKDGMSGFTKRAESEYDSFGAGHSSTSISAALGLAKARDLMGAEHKVIAVIGDGAISGGLAFEALNNAGIESLVGAQKSALPTDLVVILNDNEMSISKNVGALSKHFNDLRTAGIYLGAKNDIETVLGKWGAGDKVARALTGARDKIKYMLISGVFFEELGFKYYGPFDGNDMDTMIKMLDKIKGRKEPIVLHVYTKKGKGYRWAEENPDRFHGASPFHMETGEEKSAKKEGFSDVFGSEIVKIAEKNPKVCAITAAMQNGCGLDRFAERFPERFFDVGIAEGHAVVFGAGLSAGGMIPVFSVYSTFLQRAYDNVIHDVCLQQLPFVFVIDRAGITPGDGATHQGIFDIAFLNHIPGMTLMAPKDKAELREMLQFAVRLGAPVAVRFPKEAAYDLKQGQAPLVLGKSELLREGGDIALVAVGAMVKTALAVAERLEAQGVSAYVANARFVKPMDRGMLALLAKKCRHIFTLEDGVRIGGFGEQVAAYVRELSDPAAEPMEAPKAFDAEAVGAAAMETAIGQFDDACWRVSGEEAEASEGREQTAAADAGENLLSRPVSKAICQVTVLGVADEFPEIGTRAELLARHKMDCDGIYETICRELQLADSRI